MSQNGNPEAYEGLIQDGYNFDLNAYINRGWEIFKSGSSNLIVYGLVAVLIQGIVGVLPILSMANIVLAPLLAAGLYIIIDKYAKGRGEEANFNDLFSAKDMLGPLIIAQILVGIFVVLGFFFLVIPGIFLAIAYAFTVPLIVFGKLDFWPAMETSRKVVSKHWFNFFLMGLVQLGIILLGFIALGVGFFVAYPLVMCISYAAYEDIIMKNMGDAQMDGLINEIGDDIGIEKKTVDPKTGDF